MIHIAYSQFPTESWWRSIYPVVGIKPQLDRIRLHPAPHIKFALYRLPRQVSAGQYDIWVLLDMARDDLTETSNVSTKIENRIGPKNPAALFSRQYRNLSRNKDDQVCKVWVKVVARRNIDVPLTRLYE